MKSFRKDSLLKTLHNARQLRGMENELSLVLKRWKTNEGLPLKSFSKATVFEWTEQSEYSRGWQISVSLWEQCGSLKPKIRVGKSQIIREPSGKGDKNGKKARRVFRQTDGTGKEIRFIRINVALLPCRTFILKSRISVMKIMCQSTEKWVEESQTVSTKCTIVSATSTTLVRPTVAH